MNENSLFKRSYELIKNRRDRILSGKVNCIPWGLPRLEEIVPGIEQGNYYLISANTKVGKTQIGDWLFLYNSLNQIIEKKLNVRLKIFYFTLEMSKEEKMLQAFSNILFVKEGVRIAPIDLKSTRASTVLSKENLELIKKYEDFFKKMEETVIFIDNIRNPFGIYKFCRDYAKSNGVQHKKVVDFVDNKTGEIRETEIDDYYEPNDPDEYVIILIDHISLISQDSENGRKMSLHESITKLSSEYLITLRNKYNYIPVVIQQQAASQESLDNAKHNKLKPSLDGLGDC